jgi:hypothetical protein
MSDLVFIDVADQDAANRRRSISIIASIPGRYMLTRHTDANGNRREFSCRVVKISPDVMTLAAPVNGIVGERVIATLWEFGKFDGNIVKIYDRGFEMSMSMSEEERARFAAKIEWYEKHKNHELVDNRKSKRIVPQNPHSTVMTSDGTVVDGFIIDMSITGVAISADVDPFIGDTLAVGKVVGRVVRKFPGGFGVKFIALQNPHLLERSLQGQSQ